MLCSLENMKYKFCKVFKFFNVVMRTTRNFNNLGHGHIEHLGWSGNHPQLPWSSFRRFWWEGQKARLHETILRIPMQVQGLLPRGRRTCPRRVCEESCAWNPGMWSTKQKKNWWKMAITLTPLIDIFIRKQRGSRKGNSESVFACPTLLRKSGYIP